MNRLTQLPIPPHFQADQVGEIWRVLYQERATQAKHWAKEHQILPAAQDTLKICLLIIDAQNTFCIPGFELFVGGRSGQGAVADNRRLSEFIYRHLGILTTIVPTLDTHTTMQIFHPIFWVNEAGEHPIPAATLITLDDVQKGVWQVNPAVAHSITNGDYSALEKHALHYVRRLSEEGKYPLTVWPYHAMLGGIGHALVSAIEEAVFFHTIARNHQALFELKGSNPLTENYSVLRPEVLDSAEGKAIAEKNSPLIEKLLAFDAVLIAGQAKSHCVAWTIDDLLTEILAQDANLADKIYLLEDCTSAVVVPGVIDFTDAANATFERFADAGMHIVQSTTPIESWLQICR